MTHEIFVPHQVSVCAPAVRMIVLFAACNDDGTIEHEVLPVVALRSTLGALYVNDGDAPKAPPLGASPEEMRENGWRFVATEAREEPLLLDEESRILTVRDRCAGCDETLRVITAPWPIDEDDRRLRKIFADLDARARRERDGDEAYALACGAPEQRHLVSTI